MKKKIIIYALVFLILSNLIFTTTFLGTVYYRATVLINEAQITTGMTDVVMSADYLKDGVVKLIFIGILIMLASIVIIYFAVFKLVGVFIDRIHVIREGVERIASGNYSKKIKSKKSFLFKKQEDEFDFIINGINHMQLEVAKREMKLTDKQEALTGLLKILSQKDEELKLSYEMYRIISEETNDGIFKIDFEDGDRVSLMRTREILGYGDEEITTFEEWMSHIHPEDIENGRRIFDDHLFGRTPMVEYEYRFRAKDGEYKWLYTRAKAIFNEKEKPLQLIGSNTYIHPRKIAEENMAHLAYYDQLTGLPNRYRLKECMGQRIDEYKKDYSMFASILININNFKKVNDILGHELGDNLLSQVADKLRTLTDPEDFLGRFGGDEFIIMVDIKDHEDLEHKMKCVADLFEYYWQVEGRSFHITASIGAAIYPQDGQTRSEILKNTDVALHHSKANQNLEFAIFDSMMNHEMIERHEMENDLRSAIQNNEIYVYYQPKIRNSDKRVYGFEALARWVKPDGHVVRPDMFIPVAEETGLIVEMGRLILEKTCKKIVELNRASSEPLTIAVNLSAVQFREDDILQTVQDTIEKSGVDPTLLGIEITESIAMEDFQMVNTVLREFKNLGMHIALDDFGTGYSSLNYLKKLDIDTMKIDKSFIWDIGKEKEDEVIIDSLIRIAHGLNLEVVAEGVETEEQLNYLDNLNCNGYQGYYFSKPIPEFELTTKALIDLMHR